MLARWQWVVEGQHPRLDSIMRCSMAHVEVDGHAPVPAVTSPPKPVSGGRPKNTESFFSEEAKSRTAVPRHRLRRRVYKPSTSVLPACVPGRRYKTPTVLLERLEECVRSGAVVPRSDGTYHVTRRRRSCEATPHVGVYLPLENECTQSDDEQVYDDKGETLEERSVVEDTLTPRAVDEDGNSACGEEGDRCSARGEEEDTLTLRAVDEDGNSACGEEGDRCSARGGEEDKCETSDGVELRDNDVAEVKDAPEQNVSADNIGARAFCEVEVETTMCVDDSITDMTCSESKAVLGHAVYEDISEAEEEEGEVSTTGAVIGEDATRSDSAVSTGDGATSSGGGGGGGGAGGGLARGVGGGASGISRAPTVMPRRRSAPELGGDNSAHLRSRCRTGRSVSVSAPGDDPMSSHGEQYYNKLTISRTRNKSWRIKKTSESGKNHTDSVAEDGGARNWRGYVRTRSQSRDEDRLRDQFDEEMEDEWVEVRCGGQENEDNELSTDLDNLSLQDRIGKGASRRGSGTEKTVKAHVVAMILDNVDATPGTSAGVGSDQCVELNITECENSDEQGENINYIIEAPETIRVLAKSDRTNCVPDFVINGVPFSSKDTGKQLVHTEQVPIVLKYSDHEHKLNVSGLLSLSEDTSHRKAQLSRDGDGSNGDDLRHKTERQTSAYGSRPRVETNIERGHGNRHYHVSKDNQQHSAAFSGKTHSSYPSTTDADKYSNANTIRRYVERLQHVSKETKQAKKPRNIWSNARATSQQGCTQETDRETVSKVDESRPKNPQQSEPQDEGLVKPPPRRRGRPPKSANKPKESKFKMQLRKSRQGKSLEALRSKLQRNTQGSTRKPDAVPCNSPPDSEHSKLNSSQRFPPVTTSVGGEGWQRRNSRPEGSRDLLDGGVTRRGTLAKDGHPSGRKQVGRSEHETDLEENGPDTEHEAIIGDSHRRANNDNEMARSRRGKGEDFRNRSEGDKLKNTAHVLKPKKLRKHRHSRRSFRHDSIETFKVSPNSMPPVFRCKGWSVRSPELSPSMLHRTAPRESTEDTVDSDSRSPNQLIIDLNGTHSSEENAPEDAVTTPVNAVNQATPGRRRSLASLPETTRPQDHPEPTHRTLDSDSEDGTRKKKRKEGGIALKEMNAEFKKSQIQKNGIRLAQEIPGFNWLEEKIRNGGVPTVLPPKKCGRPRQSKPLPTAAPSSSEPSLPPEREEQVSRRPVIVSPSRRSEDREQQLHRPGELEAAARMTKMHRGSELIALQRIQRENWGQHRQQHGPDESALQVAAAADSQNVPSAHHGFPMPNHVMSDTQQSHEMSYMMRGHANPAQSRAAQLCFGDSYGRHPTVGYTNNPVMNPMGFSSANPSQCPPQDTWRFSDHVATMARHTATSFDTGLEVRTPQYGPTTHANNTRYGGAVNSQIPNSHSREQQWPSRRSSRGRRNSRPEQDVNKGQPMRPTPHYPGYEYNYPVNHMSGGRVMNPMLSHQQQPHLNGPLPSGGLSVSGQNNPMQATTAAANNVHAKKRPLSDHQNSDKVNLEELEKVKAMTQMQLQRLEHHQIAAINDLRRIEENIVSNNNNNQSVRARPAVPSATAAANGTNSSESSVPTMKVPEAYKWGAATTLRSCLTRQPEPSKLVSSINNSNPENQRYPIREAVRASDCPGDSTRPSNHLSNQNQIPFLQHAKGNVDIENIHRNQIPFLQHAKGNVDIENIHRNETSQPRSIHTQSNGVPNLHALRMNIPPETEIMIRNSADMQEMRPQDTNLRDNRTVIEGTNQYSSSRRQYNNMQRVPPNAQQVLGSHLPQGLELKLVQETPTMPSPSMIPNKPDSYSHYVDHSNQRMMRQSYQQVQRQMMQLQNAYSRPTFPGMQNQSPLSDNVTKPPKRRKKSFQNAGINGLDLTPDFGPYRHTETIQGEKPPNMRMPRIQEQFNSTHILPEATRLQHSAQARQDNMQPPMVEQRINWPQSYGSNIISLANPYETHQTVLTSPQNDNRLWTHNRRDEFIPSPRKMARLNYPEISITTNEGYNKEIRGRGTVHQLPFVEKPVTQYPSQVEVTPNSMFFGVGNSRRKSYETEGVVHTNVTYGERESVTKRPLEISVGSRRHSSQENSVENNLPALEIFITNAKEDKLKSQMTEGDSKRLCHLEEIHRATKQCSREQKGVLEIAERENLLKAHVPNPRITMSSSVEHSTVSQCAERNNLRFAEGTHITQKLGANAVSRMSQDGSFVSQSPKDVNHVQLSQHTGQRGIESENGRSEILPGISVEANPFKDVVRQVPSSHVQVDRVSLNPGRGFEEKLNTKLSESIESIVKKCSEQHLGLYGCSNPHQLKHSTPPSVERASKSTNDSIQKQITSNIDVADDMPIDLSVKKRKIDVASSNTLQKNDRETKIYNHSKTLQKQTEDCIERDNQSNIVLEKNDKNIEHLKASLTMTTKSIISQTVAESRPETKKQIVPSTADLVLFQEETRSQQQGQSSESIENGIQLPIPSVKAMDDTSNKEINHVNGLHINSDHFEKMQPNSPTTSDKKDILIASNNIQSRIATINDEKEYEVSSQLSNVGSDHFCIAIDNTSSQPNQSNVINSKPREAANISPSQETNKSTVTVSDKIHLNKQSNINPSSLQKQNDVPQENVSFAIANREVKMSSIDSQVTSDNAQDKVDDQKKQLSNDSMSAEAHKKSDNEEEDVLSDNISSSSPKCQSHSLHVHNDRQLIASIQDEENIHLEQNTTNMIKNETLHHTCEIINIVKPTLKPDKKDVRAQEIANARKIPTPTHALSPLQENVAVNKEVTLVSYNSQKVIKCDESSPVPLLCNNINTMSFEQDSKNQLKGKHSSDNKVNIPHQQLKEKQNFKMVSDKETDTPCQQSIHTSSKNCESRQSADNGKNTGHHIPQNIDSDNQEPLQTVNPISRSPQLTTESLVIGSKKLFQLQLNDNASNVQIHQMPEKVKNTLAELAPQTPASGMTISTENNNKNPLEDSVDQVSLSAVAISIENRNISPNLEQGDQISLVPQNGNKDIITQKNSLCQLKDDSTLTETERQMYDRETCPNIDEGITKVTSKAEHILTTISNKVDGQKASDQVKDISPHEITRIQLGRSANKSQCNENTKNTQLEQISINDAHGSQQQQLSRSAHDSNVTSGNKVSVLQGVSHHCYKTSLSSPRPISRGGCDIPIQENPNIAKTTASATSTVESGPNTSQSSDTATQAQLISKKPNQGSQCKLKPEIHDTTKSIQANHVSKILNNNVSQPLVMSMNTSSEKTSPNQLENSMIEPTEHTDKKGDISPPSSAHSKLEISTLIDETKAISAENVSPHTVKCIQHLLDSEGSSHINTKQTLQNTIKDCGILSEKNSKVESPDELNTCLNISCNEQKLQVAPVRDTQNSFRVNVTDVQKTLQLSNNCISQSSKQDHTDVSNTIRNVHGNHTSQNQLKDCHVILHSTNDEKNVSLNRVLPEAINCDKKIPLSQSTDRLQNDIQQSDMNLIEKPTLPAVHIENKTITPSSQAEMNCNTALSLSSEYSNLNTHLSQCSKKCIKDVSHSVDDAVIKDIYPIVQNTEENKPHCIGNNIEHSIQNVRKVKEASENVQLTHSLEILNKQIPAIVKEMAQSILPMDDVLVNTVTETTSTTQPTEEMDASPQHILHATLKTEFTLSHQRNDSKYTPKPDSSKSVNDDRNLLEITKKELQKSAQHFPQKSILDSKNIVEPIKHISPQTTLQKSTCNCNKPLQATNKNSMAQKIIVKNNQSSSQESGHELVQHVSISHQASNMSTTDGTRTVSQSMAQTIVKTNQSSSPQDSTHMLDQHVSQGSRNDGSTTVAQSMPQTIVKTKQSSSPQKSRPTCQQVSQGSTNDGSMTVSQSMSQTIVKTNQTSSPQKSRHMLDQHVSQGSTSDGSTTVARSMPQTIVKTNQTSSPQESRHILSQHFTQGSTIEGTTIVTQSMSQTIVKTNQSSSPQKSRSTCQHISQGSTDDGKKTVVQSMSQSIVKTNQSSLPQDSRHMLHQHVSQGSTNKGTTKVTQSMAQTIVKTNQSPQDSRHMSHQHVSQGSTNDGSTTVALSMSQTLVKTNQSSSPPKSRSTCQQVSQGSTNDGSTTVCQSMSQTIMKTNQTSSPQESRHMLDQHISQSSSNDGSTTVAQSMPQTIVKTNQSSRPQESRSTCQHVSQGSTNDGKITVAQSTSQTKVITNQSLLPQDSRHMLHQHVSQGSTNKGTTIVTQRMAQTIVKTNQSSSPQESRHKLDQHVSQGSSNDGSTTVAQRMPQTIVKTNQSSRQQESRSTCQQVSQGSSNDGKITVAQSTSQTKVKTNQSLLPQDSRHMLHQHVSQGSTNKGTTTVTQRMAQTIVKTNQTPSPQESRHKLDQHVSQGSRNDGITTVAHSMPQTIVKTNQTSSPQESRHMLGKHFTQDSTNGGTTIVPQSMSQTIVKTNQSSSPQKSRSTCQHVSQGSTNDVKKTVAQSISQTIVKTNQSTLKHVSQASTNKGTTIVTQRMAQTIVKTNQSPQDSRHMLDQHVSQGSTNDGSTTVAQSMPQTIVKTNQSSSPQESRSTCPQVSQGSTNDGSTTVSQSMSQTIVKTNQSSPPQESGHMLDQHVSQGSTSDGSTIVSQSMSQTIVKTNQTSSPQESGHMLDQHVTQGSTSDGSTTVSQSMPQTIVKTNQSSLPQKSRSTYQHVSQGSRNDGSTTVSQSMSQTIVKTNQSLRPKESGHMLDQHVLQGSTRDGSTTVSQSMSQTIVKTIQSSLPQKSRSTYQHVSQGSRNDGSTTVSQSMSQTIVKTNQSLRPKESGHMLDQHVLQGSTSDGSTTVSQSMSQTIVKTIQSLRPKESGHMLDQHVQQGSTSDGSTTVSQSMSQTIVKTNQSLRPKESGHMLDQHVQQGSTSDGSTTVSQSMSQTIVKTNQSLRPKESGHMLDQHVQQGSTRDGSTTVSQSMSQSVVKTNQSSIPQKSRSTYQQVSQDSINDGPTTVAQSMAPAIVKTNQSSSQKSRATYQHVSQGSTNDGSTTVAQSMSQTTVNTNQSSLPLYSRHILDQHVSQGSTNDGTTTVAQSMSQTIVKTIQSSSPQKSRSTCQHVSQGSTNDGSTTVAQSMSQTIVKTNQSSSPQGSRSTYQHVSQGSINDGSTTVAQSMAQNIVKTNQSSRPQESRPTCQQVSLGSTNDGSTTLAQSMSQTIVKTNQFSPPQESGHMLHQHGSQCSINDGSTTVARSMAQTKLKTNQTSTPQESGHMLHQHVSQCSTNDGSTTVPQSMAQTIVKANQTSSPQESRSTCQHVSQGSTNDGTRTVSQSMSQTIVKTNRSSSPQKSRSISQHVSRGSTNDCSTTVAQSMAQNIVKTNQSSRPKESGHMLDQHASQGSTNDGIRIVAQSMSQTIVKTNQSLSSQKSRSTCQHVSQGSTNDGTRTVSLSMSQTIVKTNQCSSAQDSRHMLNQHGTQGSTNDGTRRVAPSMSQTIVKTNQSSSPQDSRSTCQHVSQGSTNDGSTTVAQSMAQTIVKTNQSSLPLDSRHILDQHASQGSTNDGSTTVAQSMAQTIVKTNQSSSAQDSRHMLNQHGTQGSTNDGIRIVAQSMSQTIVKTNQSSSPQKSRSTCHHVSQGFTNNGSTTVAQSMSQTIVEANQSLSPRQSRHMSDQHVSQGSTNDGSTIVAQSMSQTIVKSNQSSSPQDSRHMLVRHASQGSTNDGIRIVAQSMSQTIVKTNQSLSPQKSSSTCQHVTQGSTNNGSTTVAQSMSQTIVETNQSSSPQQSRHLLNQHVSPGSSNDVTATLTQSMAQTIVKSNQCSSQESRLMLGHHISMFEHVSNMSTNDGTRTVAQSMAQIIVKSNQSPQESRHMLSQYDSQGTTNDGTRTVNQSMVKIIVKSNQSSSHEASRMLDQHISQSSTNDGTRTVHINGNKTCNSACDVQGSFEKSDQNGPSPSDLTTTTTISNRSNLNQHNPLNLASINKNIPTLQSKEQLQPNLTFKAQHLLREHQNLSQSSPEIGCESTLNFVHGNERNCDKSDSLMHNVSNLSCQNSISEKNVSVTLLIAQQSVHNSNLHISQETVRDTQDAHHILSDIHEPVVSNVQDTDKCAKVVQNPSSLQVAQNLIKGSQDVIKIINNAKHIADNYKGPNISRDQNVCKFVDSRIQFKENTTNTDQKACKLTRKDDCHINTQGLENKQCNSPAVTEDVTQQCAAKGMMRNVNSQNAIQFIECGITNPNLQNTQSLGQFSKNLPQQTEYPIDHALPQNAQKIMRISHGTPQVGEFSVNIPMHEVIRGNVGESRQNNISNLTNTINQISQDVVCMNSDTIHTRSNNSLNLSVDTTDSRNNDSISAQTNTSIRNKGNGKLLQPNKLNNDYLSGVQGEINSSNRNYDFMLQMNKSTAENVGLHTNKQNVCPDPREGLRDVNNSVQISQSRPVHRIITNEERAQIPYSQYASDPPQMLNVHKGVFANNHSNQGVMIQTHNNSTSQQGLNLPEARSINIQQTSQFDGRRKEPVYESHCQNVRNSSQHNNRTWQTIANKDPYVGRQSTNTNKASFNSNERITRNVANVNFPPQSAVSFQFRPEQVPQGADWQTYSQINPRVYGEVQKISFTQNQREILQLGNELAFQRNMQENRNSRTFSEQPPYRVNQQANLLARNQMNNASAIKNQSTAPTDQQDLRNCNGNQHPHFPRPVPQFPSMRQHLNPGNISQGAVFLPTSERITHPVRQHPVMDQPGVTQQNSSMTFNQQGNTKNIGHHQLRPAQMGVMNNQEHVMFNMPRRVPIPTKIHPNTMTPQRQHPSIHGGYHGFVRALEPNVGSAAISSHRRRYINSQISPVAANSADNEAAYPMERDLSRCCNCNNDAQFLCSVCQTQSYCSQSCQILMWDRHARRCRMIRQLLLQR